ncbi:MAG: PHP domain-containing protein [Thermotogota bacterium]
MHLHTNYSDGEKSPEALVKELKKNNVTHFSVTDHDNIAPFERIKRAALENNMVTLPGIEISSMYKGLEVHILGYHFDLNSPFLKALINERIRVRKERALLIFDRLNKKGYEFDQRDVESLINAHYIGRPQIANLLYAYGYIGDPSEAFCEEFIGDISSEAVRYGLKPAEEAINLVKKAGGLVFLAHPGLFIGEKGGQEGMNKYDIHQIVAFGIDGLEVFHPNHTKSQIQRYLSLAIGEKLLISMGSDYHRGDYKPNPYALNPNKYLKDVLSWLN